MNNWPLVCFHRDAIITSSVNCFTSFLAGFAVFSVLGHMAKESGTDIAHVAREGTTIYEPVHEKTNNLGFRPGGCTVTEES